MSNFVSSLVSFHSSFVSVLGPFTKPTAGGTLGVIVASLHKQSSQYHQVRHFIGGFKLLQVPLRSTPFSIAGSVSRSFNKSRLQGAFGAGRRYRRLSLKRYRAYTLK